MFSWYCLAVESLVITIPRRAFCSEGRVQGTGKRLCSLSPPRHTNIAMGLARWGGRTFDERSGEQGRNTNPDQRPNADEILAMSGLIRRIDNPARELSG